MTTQDRGPAAAWCEHGPRAHLSSAHENGQPSAATAPVNVPRGWLLIEFAGAWAAEAATTPMPPKLAKLAVSADELGLRVQLIRRPDRAVRPASADDSLIYVAWTEGPAPWLRRMTADELGPAQLEAIAAGEPSGGIPVSRPLYLVCTHGRRDRCCARFGVPLARDLAARYPAEVWETTHVDGHRFAANLVILPHGLYYGPVDAALAHAAIDAYRRGEITAGGYRGRNGQDSVVQEAEHAVLARRGNLRLPGGAEQNYRRETIAGGA